MTETNSTDRITEAVQTPGELKNHYPVGSTIEAHIEAIDTDFETHLDRTVDHVAVTDHGYFGSNQELELEFRTEDGTVVETRELPTKEVDDRIRHSDGPGYPVIVAADN